MPKVRLFEAAQRLHITPDRARRMVALGLLAGEFHGNWLYVDRESLERLERLSSEPAPPVGSAA